MKEIVDGRHIDGVGQSASPLTVVARQFKNIPINLSRLLDKVAGLVIVAIMLLIVSNVLMRSIFNSPILGTYEYVGFFTAVAVSLSLAFCALQGGHIAVDFVMERLPMRIQAVSDIIINTLSTLFFGGVAWGLFVYAFDVKSSGLVSATAQTPVHPFIYVVSLGFIMLAIVQLLKLIKSLNKGGSHNE